MSGYTKLFGSIVSSTVWRESKDTKILWVTMLAMADMSGVVEASIPGLADLARLTIPETEASLLALSSPDPYSRTKEHEGRRIKAVDGGWVILNHAKYREKCGSTEATREYWRLKKEKQRAKEMSGTVQDNPGKSTMSLHTEPEPYSDSKSNTESSGAGAGAGAVPVPRGSVGNGQEVFPKTIDEALLRTPYKWSVTHREKVTGLWTNAFGHDGTDPSGKPIRSWERYVVSAAKKWTAP